MEPDDKQKQMMRERCLKLALEDGFKGNLEEILEAASTFNDFIIKGERYEDDPSNYDEIPL